jgi:hypothetical protein
LAISQIDDEELTPARSLTPADVDRAAARRAKREDDARALDAVKREEASDFAADMELGYYQTQQHEQWEPRPFVIAELLRRMGYGEWTIKNGRRPRWWPGNDAFRKLVAWKVAVRRMQTQLDLGNRNAWAGPLVAMAVEEMGHRLARNPEKITDATIADLIVRLTKIFKDSAPSGGPTAPAAPSASIPAGSRFRITRETIEMLPEGPTRDKAIRDLDAVLSEARVAIAAPAPAGDS